MRTERWIAGLLVRTIARSSAAIVRAIGNHADVTARAYVMREVPSEDDLSEMFTNPAYTLERTANDATDGLE